jgi:hypothetical protein
MLKIKGDLGCGILIGMGVVLIILGSFGWFVANYISGTLEYILSECGIDTSRHYIFSELNHLMHTDAFLIVIGIVSLTMSAVYRRFQR